MIRQWRQQVAGKRLQRHLVESSGTSPSGRAMCRQQGHVGARWDLCLSSRVGESQNSSGVQEAYCQSESWPQVTGQNCFWIRLALGCDRPEALLAFVRITEPEKPHTIAEALFCPGWEHVCNTSPCFLAIFHRIAISTPRYFWGPFEGSIEPQSSKETKGH